MMNIVPSNTYLGPTSGYAPPTQSPSGSPPSPLFTKSAGDSYAGSGNIFSNALDTSAPSLPKAPPAADTNPPSPTGADGLNGSIAAIMQLLTSILPMLLGQSQGANSQPEVPAETADVPKVPKTANKAEVPGAPGAEKPGTPGAEKPGAPGAEKPGAPGAEKPGTPGAEKPGAPGAEKPGAPGAKKPGAPGAEEPGTKVAPTKGSSVDPSGQIRLYGGSASGENNLEFENASDKDIYVAAQVNLEKGEKDPGLTVFKVPKGGKVSVSAKDKNGLRFQPYDGDLTPEQKAKLDKDGVTDGAAPSKHVDTLYESFYNPENHTSHDDVSPLDGAKTGTTVKGQGGRTVSLSQEMIDAAPGKDAATGFVPGLGPSVSPKDNEAKNPALRDYYQKNSLKADGTRDFYYNSSNNGDADLANVSYTGSKGKIRSTITLGA